MHGKLLEEVGVGRELVDLEALAVGVHRKEAGAVGGEGYLGGGRVRRWIGVEKREEGNRVVEQW